MNEMTIDERLRLPCGICSRSRSEHIGKAFCCPGGYGTGWNPEGKRDERVWPKQGAAALSQGKGDTRERLAGLVANSNPPLPVFLRWIGNRLKSVYGESEHVDFVQACFRRANELEAALSQSTSPHASGAMGTCTTCGGTGRSAASNHSGDGALADWPEGLGTSNEEVVRGVIAFYLAGEREKAVQLVGAARNAVTDEPTRETD